VRGRGRETALWSLLPTSTPSTSAEVHPRPPFLTWPSLLPAFRATFLANLCLRDHGDLATGPNPWSGSLSRGDGFQRRHWWSGVSCLVSSGLIDLSRDSEMYGEGTMKREEFWWTTLGRNSVFSPLRFRPYLIPNFAFLYGCSVLVVATRYHTSRAFFAWSLWRISAYDGDDVSVSLKTSNFWVKRPGFRPFVRRFGAFCIFVVY
jgi:hypothetical protein